MHEGPVMGVSGASARCCRYSLRKRKRTERQTAADSVEQFLKIGTKCKNIVVFSGSGLSATTGVSLFSTKGGLYEKAQKKFRVADGKRLFTYPFYTKNKADVQAFFVDIFNEVSGAEPGPSHHSLATLRTCGVLRRHYTLNIDGLASSVGLDTWEEKNTDGSTVEMHGNIRQLVCPECSHVVHLGKVLARQLSLKQPKKCPECGKGTLRFRIMLYEDQQGDCITQSELMWSQMERDLESADLVLWIGISFEQSASVEYFRKVRGILLGQGREGCVPQVVINPSDGAMWNLLSASSNIANLDVLEVTAECDAVLPELTARISTINSEKQGSGDCSPAQ